MSIITFDGVGAGIAQISGSGDRNDPANYTLFCPNCHHELGPLARFRENSDGVRSPGCLKCEHVSLIKGTDVLKVIPMAAVIAQKTAAGKVQ